MECPSQEFSQNVWDDKYCAVWHLNDPYDSTKNGNNGVISGSSTSWKPGKSGLGLEITNKGMMRDIPDSFDDSISSEFTVSSWVKWYGKDPSYPSPSYVFDARADLTYGGFILFISEDGTVQFFQLIGNTFIRLRSASTISKDTWTHVCVVYNYNSKDLCLFINGVEDNSTSISATYHDTYLNPSIGNNRWGYIDGQYRPMNGITDELHVLKTSRSTDWILTEYNNQNAPSNFMSFGPEELGP